MQERVVAFRLGSGTVAALFIRALSRARKGMMRNAAVHLFVEESRRFLAIARPACGA